MPLIFTSGWASGINCYAVVLVLGLLGRFGHMSAVPLMLERPDVLCVAFALFLCQFLIGKIPHLDSVWEIAHTAIRPVLGGAIAVLIAHHGQGSMGHAVAAIAVGGGTSLVTHLSKTGIRLGVNTSPEPVSNIVVSALEDLAVAGITALALLHPVAAATLAATLLVLSLLVAGLLAWGIQRIWRKRSNRGQQPHVGRRMRDLWMHRSPHGTSIPPLLRNETRECPGNSHHSDWYEPRKSSDPDWYESRKSSDPDWYERGKSKDSDWY